MADANLDQTQSAAVCGICFTPLQSGESVAACPSCQAHYHQDCWEENGGCGAYGCAQAPAVEQRRAIEIPVSFWGQEHKPCPACGHQILAAAVRCRHCGATFASARPEDSDEFQRRTTLKERLPKAKRTIVVTFGLSLLPFIAPFAAVWGFIWHTNHREELQALPSLYNALSKIGLAVATGQTILLVIMTVLFVVVRGS
jgi:RING finger family protein